MNITDDCKMDDGFINYLTFVFCLDQGKLVPLGLVILVNISKKQKEFIFNNYYFVFKRLFGYSSHSLALV